MLPFSPHETMMVLKDQLYSLSTTLMGSVCGIARSLKDALPERLNLVDYITLPDYGQRVILRFEVLEPIPRSAEEADALESRLRAAVGPDYWANVRIDWSRTANKDNKTLLDHGALCERLQAIDKAYPDSVLTLPRTIHSRLVAEDADRVRAALDLPEGDRAWEVEVPVGEGTEQPVIRIVRSHQFGREMLFERRAAVGGHGCLVQFMENNNSFRGCQKAYLASEAQQKAMQSFIMRFGE